MGSFSQTLFFGGVKRQPEIRLRSQATGIGDFDLFCKPSKNSGGVDRGIFHRNVNVNC